MNVRSQVRCRTKGKKGRKFERSSTGKLYPLLGGKGGKERIKKRNQRGESLERALVCVAGARRAEREEKQDSTSRWSKRLSRLISRGKARRRGIPKGKR